MNTNYKTSLGYTLLILWVSFFSIQGFSQNADWCGMQHDPIYEAFYTTQPASNFVARSSRAATIYVPIYYHLIGETNRTGTTKLAEVLQSHCDLNAAYASSDIQFYIAGIDSIFNSSYYIFATSATGDAIMRAFNVPNVCNVYVNRDPRGVCGYAFFPGSGPNGGGIFINKTCYGTGSSTLIHEMGHYCGLPHTFESFGGVEYVDGSNCSNAGDYFCDTPADFLDYRWTCPYTGNQTDPKGALYKTVLDGGFYMSYSNDNCQNKFSPAQRTYMYNTLKNQRSSLVNNSFTGFVQFDTTSLVTPLYNDSTVSPNNATFVWNAVPGAQYYLFQIPSPNPNIIYADTVVTDTFVTIKGLTLNRGYLYRVQAFSYLSNCNSFTATRPFKTSSISISASAILACENESNGSIKLNITGVGAPYSIQWSNGSFEDSISGLSVGEYTVTVTGTNGEISTSTSFLPTPVKMESTFYQQSGKVNINVFAGTGPYTYLWSDGSTASQSNGGNASYTVSVTDANGCTKVFNYYPAGIADYNNELVTASLYPNPTQNKKATLEVKMELESTATIILTDIKGSVVLVKSLATTKGINKVNLDLESVEAGIYVVRLESKNGQWRGRLAVH